MKFEKTYISGLMIIEPEVFTDERGMFFETYQERKFNENGIPWSFVQDNHSVSRMGVLRGLHYQTMLPQGKLIRVVYGSVYDVAVDLRKDSATFGQWFSVVLSATNRKMLWIPQGFAHGFYATTPWAEVVYKATDFYAPQYEESLVWNDPDLAIEWPISANEIPILSTKDANGRLFKDLVLSN
jgi:dTDP-4-dehydrorhamnose 3,5-epimerase